MVETLFDTASGGTFMNIPGAAVEQSGSSTVVPLVDLLNDDHFPVTIDDFEKTTPQEWTKERYIEFGKWAVTVLAEEEAEPLLKYKHLRRLYLLGLVPEPKNYIDSQASFETTEAFRRAIGAKSGYEAGRFDNWDEDRYRRAARIVEAMVERKPSKSDYDAAAQAGIIPTESIRRRDIGGTDKLNELLDYANTPTWSHEDFLLFGLRFIEVNGLDAFQLQNFAPLAQRGRGPDREAIRRDSTSWQNYSDEVLERLPAYLNSTKQERSEYQLQSRRLSRYRQAVAAKQLPAEYGDLDDQQLLQRAGQYLLVRTFQPKLRPEQKHRVAALQADPLIEFLIKSSPGLTRDRIEQTAHDLGIHIDIWPVNKSYYRYLKLTPEQLEAVRAKQSQVRQRYQHKSQSQKSA